MSRDFDIRIKFSIKIVFLAGLGTLLAIVLPNYYQFSSIESISFYVKDGWCDSLTQGIGVHCFGDYYYPVKFASLSNPWGSSAFAYPPLPTFIFHIFSSVSSISGVPRFGLLLYLFTLVTVVIIPGIWMIRKANSIENFSLQFKYYFCAGLTFFSAPIIVVIDRGNNIGVLFTLVFFHFVCFKEGKRKESLALIMLAILFKPQFILLLLLHFNRRNDLKGAFQYLSIVISSFFLLFLLYPIGIFHNIMSYLEQTSAFQLSPLPGNLFPINISLVNVIGLLARSLGYPITKPIIITLITATLLIFGALLFLKNFRLRSSSTNILLITFIVIFVPAVSFHYYWIFLSIPIFFLLIEKDINTEIFNNFINRNLLFIGAGLILVPWPIPWSLIFSQSANHVFGQTGMNWLIGQLTLLLLFLKLLIVRPNQKRFKP